jgi:hypothetical protein
MSSRVCAVGSSLLRHTEAVSSRGESFIGEFARTLRHPTNSFFQAYHLTLNIDGDAFGQLSACNGFVTSAIDRTRFVEFMAMRLTLLAKT